MPDSTPLFRLPTPLQPKSHHALGLHNAPVFEYDLSEYTGEGGKPLVVLEPRRGDGRPQAPFSWFAQRVIEGVSETYAGAATIVIHEIENDGTDSWMLTREVPIPVFDENDAATMKQLQDIKAQATASGVRPEQAIHQAVMSGLLKPTDVRMRKAVVTLDGANVNEVMTELFSHHVAPPAAEVHIQKLGFVGQAVRQEADRQATAPCPEKPARRAGNAPKPRQVSGPDSGLAA